MKFKNAVNVTGRGNVLVVDLEEDNFKVGDRITFEICGIESVSGNRDNVGLVLRTVVEEKKNK